MSKNEEDKLMEYQYRTIAEILIQHRIIIDALFHNSMTIVGKRDYPLKAFIDKQEV